MAALCVQSAYRGYKTRQRIVRRMALLTGEYLLFSLLTQFTVKSTNFVCTYALYMNMTYAVLLMAHACICTVLKIIYSVFVVTCVYVHAVHIKTYIVTVHLYVRFVDVEAGSKACFPGRSSAFGHMHYRDVLPTDLQLSAVL